MDKLTPRQRQVMALKARGMTERQIAQSLGIAYSTVKTYSHRARKRTQRTTIEIVMAVVNA